MNNYAMKAPMEMFLLNSNQLSSLSLAEPFKDPYKDALQLAADKYEFIILHGFGLFPTPSGD